MFWHGGAVTCIDLAHAEPDRTQDDDRCSWLAIAAAVRSQAEALPAEARTELEQFADLLDGIALLKVADGER
jgi:hypothetical protein